MGEYSNGPWYRRNVICVYFFGFLEILGWFRTLYFLFWILAGLTYVFYILPNYVCGKSEEFGNIMGWCILISLIVLPFVIRKYSTSFIYGPILYECIVMIPFLKADTSFIHKGPSVIRKCQVTRIGRGKMYYAEVMYNIGDRTYHDKISPCNPDGREWVYGIHNPACKTSMLLYSDEPTESEIAQIQDVAFEQDSVIYTLKQYSIVNPQFVYYNYGINVVGKAVLDSIKADYSVYLLFYDIADSLHIIDFKAKDYSDNIPDTFLISYNLNRKFSKEFTVCAPEVNIPENWAKISDYGYIFHYDVYSKEEIESQCPQIRNYVEKYKERMMAK